MRISTKGLLRTIGKKIPDRCYRLLIRKNVVSLCYHVVSVKPLSHITIYNYKTPAEFEEDIKYLIHNFELLSYEQFIAAVKSKDKTRAKQVLLTFDDGLSQCFSVVRPILLKYKVPCVFFITTDFIDNKSMFYENKISLCIGSVKKLRPSEKKQVVTSINKITGLKFTDAGSLVLWLSNLGYFDDKIISEVCRILGVDIARYLNEQKPYLTLEEIRILAAEGFTIGAHGKTHIRLDLLSKADAEKEIVDSSKEILSGLGIKHLPFAFPYHGNFIDRSFLKRILMKNKFIDLFFDTQRLRDDHDFIMHRIWADSPPSSGSGRSNISELLKLAYIDHFRHKYL
jgi:peptidoglycan/xylan/chitin deacetylase (PgdA/CDA1 family)